MVYCGANKFGYYAKDFVCVLCVVMKSLLFINKRLCYKLSNWQIYQQKGELEKTLPFMPFDFWFDECLYYIYI